MMKLAINSSNRFQVGLVLVAALWAVTPDADAQTRRSTDQVLKIRSLTGSKEKSPTYATSLLNSDSGKENWYMLRTRYNTEEDWLDDITMTYYVLFKPDPDKAMLRLDPRRPVVLMRGVVSYMNVPKGRHDSAMFLHPNTLSRYGEPQRVAVVATYQGRRVDAASEPDGSDGWWDQLTPVEGQIFNRNETPYGPAASDEFEMIKPEGARR